jgi:hypothetical protein
MMTIKVTFEVCIFNPAQGEKPGYVWINEEDAIKNWKKYRKRVVDEKLSGLNVLGVIVIEIPGQPTIKLGDEGLYDFWRFLCVWAVNSCLTYGYGIVSYDSDPGNGIKLDTQGSEVVISEMNSDPLFPSVRGPRIELLTALFRCGQRIMDFEDKIWQIIYDEQEESIRVEYEEFKKCIQETEELLGQDDNDERS